MLDRPLCSRRNGEMSITGTHDRTPRKANAGKRSQGSKPTWFDCNTWISCRLHCSSRRFIWSSVAVFFSPSFTLRALWLVRRVFSSSFCRSRSVSRASSSKSFILSASACRSSMSLRSVADFSSSIPTYLSWSCRRCTCAAVSATFHRS